MAEEIRRDGRLPEKPRWERPRLKTVGAVGDVLQGGGGKLSSTGGDPGETRKEKPTG